MCIRDSHREGGRHWLGGPLLHEEICERVAIFMTVYIDPLTGDNSRRGESPETALRDLELSLIHI